MNQEDRELLSRPKRRWTIVALITLAVLAAVAAGVIFYYGLKSVKGRAEEREAALQQKLDKSEEARRAAEREARELRAELANMRLALTEANRNIGARFLTIYTADLNTLKPRAFAYVAVPKEQRQQYKLQLIADRISHCHFRGYPIMVEDIVERDGEDIALINLKDPPGDPIDSWYTQFFQGSTGASATMTSLQYSFLQPNLEGEWVDGIQFLYNDEEVTEPWDHVDLRQTMMRDDLRKQRDNKRKAQPVE